MRKMSSLWPHFYFSDIPKSVHIVYHLLFYNTETSTYHDGYFVVTGCTWACHYHNLVCGQGIQNSNCDYLSVSVILSCIYFVFFFVSSVLKPRDDITPKLIQYSNHLRSTQFNFHSVYLIMFQFCIDHDNIMFMLCTNLRNGWATMKWFVDKERFCQIWV